MDAITSRHRRGLGAISALAAVLAVSSCSLLPGTGGACTAIGNAEGVSVDLTRTPGLQGGDLLVEVCLPDLDACGSGEATAGDEHGSHSRVDADLTDDPVTVVVTVRDEPGDVVLERRASATPQPYQPNGARCDGKNYRIDLGFDADGRLVPQRLP